MPRFLAASKSKGKSLSFSLFRLWNCNAPASPPPLQGSSRKKLLHKEELSMCGSRGAPPLKALCPSPLHHLERDPPGGRSAGSTGEGGERAHARAARPRFVLFFRRRRCAFLNFMCKTKPNKQPRKQKPRVEAISRGALLNAVAHCGKIFSGSEAIDHQPCSHDLCFFFLYLQLFSR